MPPRALTEPQLRRVLEASRALVARLELEAVLDEVLEAARELTGARYAAIGVLDERRAELERFVFRGVDQATADAVGELPRGRGVLGALIDDPRPLRLPSVGADPRSFGFPPGHPPMEGFLGVPILIRGEAWGNLYLTEKLGAEEFDEVDEEIVVLLGEWAGIAVENARLYEDLAARRDALERVVQRLEATTAISHALGAETDLERVLELIATRGRALVGARAVCIALEEDDGLVVAAGAGEVTGEALGEALPGAMVSAMAGSLRARVPHRIDEMPRELARVCGVVAAPAPRSALFVPLVYRDRPLGVLAAFDRRGDQTWFEADHEELLGSFAVSAAIAVATARSVAQERLRQSLAAAERERGRWARELHDETLQGLGGLRILLSSALRRDDAALRVAVEGAVEQLATDIDGLRALITELRPAALDEIGLGPAVEALLERTAAMGGLEADLHLDLGGVRLAPEVETAVYRLVQEALTNVVKHAGAERLRVRLREVAGSVHVEVADDGSGFDPAAATRGFGLLGMHERAASAGGSVDLSSSDAGTRVRARFPARHVERAPSSLV